MSESQPALPLEGRWEIHSVEGYDEAELRVELEPFVEFRAEGDGAFHFALIRGSMEYRVEEQDGQPVAQFTFDAHHGAEPLCGGGSAAVVGGQLEGVIWLHTGQQSRFVARRTS